MTDSSGTYALLLRPDDEERIEVGALGEMSVRAGVYVYVGSAFGPGGLRARVQRHVKGEGARHWHVDYLRAATTLETVWYTHDDTRRECRWASILRNHPTSRVPMAGFGASDCDCSAHLVAFEGMPSFLEFRRRVQAACPDHTVIEQVSPANFVT